MRLLLQSQSAENRLKSLVLIECTVELKINENNLDKTDWFIIDGNGDFFERNVVHMHSYRFFLDSHIFAKCTNMTTP